MIVFLNGKFVPEHEATVSIFDRGYLYGDGLFETMLVKRGIPFRWDSHMRRLEQGAEFLSICIPFKGSQLREFAARLISENQTTDALLRLSVSRGVGPRGYSPRGANTPFVSMSIHPWQHDLRALAKWNLVTSRVRLPANETLALVKHANKLPQVLARAQADQAGADEALLTNTDGELVEGASSNLFWIQKGAICTPPLAAGILSGVTRAVVNELSTALRLPFREVATNQKELLNAEGVFLSLSSYGIVEAVSLDGTTLPHHPFTRLLHAAYADLVERETAQDRRSAV